jgi:hypothetical protein
MLICVMTHAEQPMPDKPAVTAHPLQFSSQDKLLCSLKFSNFPIQQHLSFIYLVYFVCLSTVRQSVVADHCYLLFYRQGNNQQTDQEDDTKGLDGEGLEMEEFERQRLEGECVKKLFIV